MKKAILFLSFFALCHQCVSQNRIIQNSDIQFEVDISNWHVQNHQQVLNILKEYGQEKQFTEDEIVAVFTYDKLPAYNLPSIQIINRKTDKASLFIEKLEKEHGTFDEGQLNTAQTVNFDVSKPTIIKSKQLILMETVNEMHGAVTLKKRQALFCLEQNLIIVQFAYLNNRDTKYIEDFNQIVNSIKFN